MCARVLHRWLANSCACCKPCSRRRKKEENEREKCRSTRRRRRHCHRRHRGSAAWLCSCSCWRVSYMRRRPYVFIIFIIVYTHNCVGDSAGTAVVSSTFVAIQWNLSEIRIFPKKRKHYRWSGRNFDWAQNYIYYLYLTSVKLIFLRQFTPLILFIVLRYHVM